MSVGKMTVCRKSLDSSVIKQLTSNCTCTITNCSEELKEKERSELCGWVGRPVTSWSAHVTTASELDLIVMKDLQNKSNSSGNHTATNHSGTTGCKPDHSRTIVDAKIFAKSSNINTSTTLLSTTTMYQKRPTGYQTKPNSSVYQPKLTTICKPLPKPPAHRPSLYCDIPEIPFQMDQIHTNHHYRRMRPSLAHIEHYLTSYTYPQLDARLYQSLSRGLCPECDGALLRGGGGGGGGRGGRRNEREIRLNIVEVLVGKPSHSSSCSSSSSQPSRLSGSQVRSTRSDDATTILGPSPYRHQLKAITSHPPLPPPHPPPHSSLSQQVNNYRSDLNKNNNKSSNRSKTYRHREVKFNNEKTKKTKTSRRSSEMDRNSGAPKELSTHSQAFPHTVYKMGVHLTQNSFPPLVISNDSNTQSKRQSHVTTTSDTDPVTASGRGRKTTNRLSYARSTRSTITNSLESISSLIVSASSLWNTQAVSKTSVNDQRISCYGSRGEEETQGGGRTAKISTTTLSPFRAPQDKGGGTDSGGTCSYHESWTVTPNKLSREYHPMTIADKTILSPGHRFRRRGHKREQQEDNLLFLTGTRAGGRHRESERDEEGEEREEPRSQYHYNTRGRNTRSTIL